MPEIAGNHVSAGTRPFVALASAVLLLGIADSMAGSYLVLFAADYARLTPVQIGLFSAAPAAGGLVISVLAGRRFDRRPSRRYAIIGAALSAVGFVLLTTTTSFVMLLLIGLMFLAASQAVFPQLFALARVVLGEGRAGRRSAPLLRSCWSLAWALGPLAGAVMMSRTGFSAMFWVAAAILALAAVGTAAAPAPPRRQVHAEASESGAGESADAPAWSVPLAVLVASVVLFFAAMAAGSVVLPLFVTRELHLPDSAIGLLYSACAAVEVLAALLVAGLPQRVSQRALITVAMGLLGLYFVATVLADGMAGLLVAQVARGTAIAVVGAAGIRFFQDLLAPAVGRATTLFANAGTAGALLAGLLAGLSIQHWGYTTTLLLCGGAALAGSAAFCLATLPRFGLLHRPDPVEQRGMNY